MDYTSSAPATRHRPSGRVLDPDRSWSQLLGRGVLAIAFGLLALLWPGLTLLGVAVIFGVYAIIHGAGLLLHGIRGGDTTHRVISMLGGLLGIVAGVIALLIPVLSVLALALVIGIWAVVVGIVEVTTAIRLHDDPPVALLVGLGGVLSLVAGVLILAHPLAGAFGLAVILGAYALVYGLVLVVSAMRLRHRSPHAQHDH